MQKISLLAVLLLFAATAFATRKDAVGKVRTETKKEATRTKKANHYRPDTKKLTGLHPQTQRKLKAAFKDMQAIGVCPIITSAYRSSAQQQKCITVRIGVVVARDAAFTVRTDPAHRCTRQA